MFGMGAAAGLNILSQADLSRRANQLVIAVSFGCGMIPLASPKFFAALPDWTAPIVHSGIMLTTIVAVLSNLLLNGAGESSPGDRRRNAAHRAGAPELHE